MLAGAVLEIAWCDYEATREPVFRWLDNLCRWPDPTVRLRAAYAVARLASLDFPAVRERLLEEWSLTLNPRLIQAAGRVVEGVMLRGEAVEAAEDLLGTWSRSRVWTQAAAVLAAYAGPIGRARAAEALEAVDRVLAIHSRLLGPWAEWTLGQIFRFGGEEPVLRLLSEWQRGIFTIREHASGSFLHTVLQGREAASGRLAPTLSVLVVEDRLRFDDLERLWRGALRSRGHRGRAWRGLRVWHEVARRPTPADRTEAETHALIQNLLLELGAHQDLHALMRHHEEIWNSGASPSDLPRRRET